MKLTFILYPSKLEKMTATVMITGGKTEVWKERSIGRDFGGRKQWGNDVYHQVLPVKTGEARPPRFFKSRRLGMISGTRCLSEVGRRWSPSFGSWVVALKPTKTENGVKMVTGSNCKQERQMR